MYKRQAVGDEGGFAPALDGTEDALNCILAAIEAAGYEMCIRDSGITVPQFPNGSSSLFYHIAITGIRLVACQQESNIATPHTGKLTHHPVHTYHPTADMTFIPGDNACYYL